jgi:hypothetical protein
MVERKVVRLDRFVAMGGGLPMFCVVGWALADEQLCSKCGSSV